MLEVYRFNQNGEYIEPVHLYPDDSGQYSIPVDCTEKPLPQPNWKPIFMNGEWVETITADEQLNTAKQNKLQQLDEQCTSAIMDLFTADVNGVTYQFSHDIKAQNNFSSAKLNFLENPSSPPLSWTAYDSNGTVVRLSLDKSLFDPVFIAHLQHIQTNISKFRDTLQPKVEQATTIEEVNGVIW